MPTSVSSAALATWSTWDGDCDAWSVAVPSASPRSIPMHENRITEWRTQLFTLDRQSSVPLDYKRGKRPHVARGAYEPERVQLQRASAAARVTRWAGAKRPCQR